MFFDMIWQGWETTARGPHAARYKVQFGPRKPVAKSKKSQKIFIKVKVK